jgi:hypothetical protein
MATVDLRDTTMVHSKGSSLLAFGLTAAQGAAAFPTGHGADVGGWIVLGNLQGGTIRADRDIEEVKDEADSLVETTVNRDEFVIANTLMQTDSDTLNFLTWLEDNAVPARYPLPLKNNTTHSQWWLFYSVTSRKNNYTINTGNEGRRRAFEILAAKDSSGNLYVVEDLPDDTTHADWTNYSEFIDTAFP